MIEKTRRGIFFQRKNAKSYHQYSACVDHFASIYYKPFYLPFCRIPGHSFWDGHHILWYKTHGFLVILSDIGSLSQVDPS